MARNIAVIPARPVYELRGNQATAKQKVCAYCRVSTGNEDQLTSYDAQINHYSQYIANNLEWEFAGIYADEGISGTSTKNRTNFNRMIEDCLAGKIDMIVTKSISRFARNTLDCLKYIRLLKDKGVAVFFEKENVNTLDSKGEFLLTLLGSLAQEESRSISTSTRWGIVHRFQQGIPKVNHTRFLGYTKNEEGQLVIDPKEEKIVKRIFREYLEGKGAQKIADNLTRDRIITSGGNKKWHSSTILKILNNEKYMGDALLQKTITTDFLSKKREKNTGQVPQYYVENSHEAIISKELFMTVQEEMVRRRAAEGLHKKSQSSYKARYALTGRIQCSECGALYQRCHWTIKNEKVIVWRCGNRQHNGPEECKAPTLTEDSLHKAIVRVFNKLIDEREFFIKNLMDNIEKVIVKDTKPLEEINKELKELEQKLIGYVQLNARMGADSNRYDGEYEKLSAKIAILRKKKEAYDIADAKRDITKARIKELKKILMSQQHELMEYDDSLVRQLIEKIKVLSEEQIQIEFKSGFIMKEMITE